MRIVAMILAGGQGRRLSILSEKRAKPAVPFAGKYRIIDFTLSNCVNSGISDVGILTQYRPYSLNQHVATGRPWDLDRTKGGVTLLHPYLGREETQRVREGSARDHEASKWYQGTADAIRQNLDFIRRNRADLVLILAGDHVYKMDYGALADFHKKKRADLTVATIAAPAEGSHRLGMITTDADERVTGFVEKPERPTGSLASMGIYMFEPGVLEEQLTHPSGRGYHDFGRDVIPHMIQSHRVYAHRFTGYWVDVGTVETYWEAHMDLLSDHPPLDLGDLNWLIHTRSEERPPAKVSLGARIEQSLISHGCVIEGTVRRSILSPGVCVGRGAVVNDSIILTDSVIGAGASLDRTILDKQVTVGADARLGTGEDYTPNKSVQDWITVGVNLVGKNARLPEGLVVGRNCIIAGDLTEEDFPSRVVPSGSTVGVDAG